MVTPDIPAEAGSDGKSQCPIGTACQLQVVNREQMFCECIPDNRGHRCPNALAFGNSFYCRSLWKMPPVKL